MDNKKIAKILYSMSMGLGYADGIEFAEQEIDCISDELSDIGDSLFNVIETIAYANAEQENVYKKYLHSDDKVINEKKVIPYYLQCMDSYIYVSVDSDKIERTLQIIDKAYDRWMDSDDSERLDEYLVSAIKDAGIECTYECDGDDEDEE